MGNFVYTRMKIQILAATALVALTSMLAHAQTSGGPPTPPTPAQMVANQVARLTNLLDLNTTQQASATTIFTTEQTALATLRTSLQTARSALQTAIKSDDTGTIGTESTQIGALTGQEVLAQATAAGAFYAILTAGQQTKYESLGPMGGGPGGFGGPGGPGPRLGGSH
jgi:Spy/CpxP family protein refolding chaperone